MADSMDAADRKTRVLNSLAERGGVFVGKMLEIRMALIEDQRQPVVHLPQAVAQAQDDQWRCDAAAFKSGIANASGHAGHQLDQPFLLAVVDIEDGLHYGRSAMAHAQKVVQAAGPVG